MLLKVIFWIIYIIIALSLTLTPLISGIIWSNSIGFQDIHIPIPINPTKCLVVCNSDTDTSCIINPPIWLILCGCFYGIGFLFASYPLYDRIFYYDETEEKGIKFFIPPLLAFTFFVVIFTWGWLAIKIPEELNSTRRQCVKTMSTMIATFSIINFVIFGISMITILWFMKVYL